jgi:Gas vesicle synthesis protein GvpO
VDVVETRRVPSTTDLIAVYEMEIDREGELLGYERKRHYVRGRGDNDRGERS